MDGYSNDKIEALQAKAKAKREVLLQRSMEFTAHDGETWLTRHTRYNKNARLAKVTRETTTRWGAQEEYEDGTLSPREILIAKKTGKEIGSYDAYWRTCDPDVVRHNNRVLAVEYAEKELASALKAQERMDRVKAANPNLERKLIPGADGVYLVLFTDFNGHQHLLVFRVELQERYGGTEIYHLRTASTDLNEGNDGFGSSSADGETVDEAVLNYIASWGHF